MIDLRAGLAQDWASKMLTGTPISALFLAAPNPLSIGIVARWLQAGHRVTSIWYPERARLGRAFQADARMANAVPFLSMHGLVEQFELNCQPVPRLAQNPELSAKARAENPDIVISAMFMDLIPKVMIEAFPMRIFNLHPSMLPAYRGPSPLLGMLWDQTIERYSGLTLHLVSEGFDEGAILAQRRVEFPPSWNIGMYIGASIEAGGRLLRESIPAYLNGETLPTPQVQGTGNYSNIRKSQLKIARSFSLERVTWLCKTIGQFAEFRIEGAPENVRVNRISKVLGLPTGSPDQYVDDYAEFDITDARVRLGRSQVSSV